MTAATELGAMILPPVPAFYHSPRTIQDLIDHIVGKILDSFDIEHSLFRRWDGGNISEEDPRQSVILKHPGQEYVQAGIR